MARNWAIEDFKYVDAFHLNPQTGQRTKWERKDVADIEEFRNRWNNYNVFTTVQRYRIKTRQESGSELMYAPLFFDIDSSRPLAKDTAPGGKPGLIEEGLVHPKELENVLPKELVVHAENFGMGIPIPDEVCDQINELTKSEPDVKRFVWLKNLETSRSDAVKLVHFFMERFHLSEDEIRVYFSGSKGFHVLVEPIVLGIKPDKNLHRLFKFIALHLESLLGLRSLDTASIYGHGRMLRLVNSVHYKSGLFKVELHHAELKGELSTVVDDLAKAPRPDLYDPELIELNLNEVANEWYLRLTNGFLESDKLKAEQTAQRVDHLKHLESIPECVQFVLDHGILKKGDRNKATMVLASFFKDTGHTLEDTVQVLTNWAEKIPSSMTSSAPAEVRSSTISCVKTVYQDDRYHFKHAFIKSLHGEKNGGQYQAIPCAGRLCPAHEDYLSDAEPARFMPLAKTSDAELTGKKVGFDALVSGMLDTPYIVPKKVRYTCNCGKDGCILQEEHGGVLEREFYESERFLIEATNQNDTNLKGILTRHSLTNCKKPFCDVLEYINVSEILVVPMADRVKTVKTEAGAKEIDQDGNEYVTRKIYTIGNEVQPNQHYTFEGYVYSHPKNSMATVLSQKHTAKEDSISKFTLTDEMREQFKVFQVAPGEELDDRVSLVISDLVDNVTLVRERFEAHLATLMTYHSCLHYYFQSQLEKRGWMETVFVGDSGQAKTQLVSNLMEFIGLGNMTSGEGASRTGLVYRLEQVGERWFLTWGKYPLSDKKLIAIDEFGELSPDDFGKITEARTTGVLKVDRAVNTETNARVRMLLMTNPLRGRVLSSYTHGVESLKTLFASPADIRRLDLAVFLQTGDVPKSVLNAEYNKPEVQLVPSEVLRNSVLWAWSRTAEQIEITPPAMRRILKKADELAEKYGYAQDIPLLEPSDLRKKIARMAIALAGLVHSTNEDHEKIVVHPEHVNYVSEFIGVIYDNKNARLDVYSAKSKEESELTEEERQQVTKALEDLDFADNATVSAEVVELFRRNDILKPAEIIDMLGFERGQVNSRLAILTKHSMIKRTREGLRKLPKFIEFLNN